MTRGFLKVAQVTGLMLAILTLGGCMKSKVCADPLWQGAQAGQTVGTYDRVELLVAYHKWEVFDARLSAMVHERDGAKARGDTTRVDELERLGSSMQERSHRQLVGKEPLTNIAEDLRDVLPTIASEAGVWKILDREALEQGTPFIDVTPKLIEHLPPAKRHAK